MTKSPRSIAGCRRPFRPARNGGPVLTRSLLAGVVLLAGASASGADAPDFEREIAPLIAGRCLECHSGRQPSGGLDLTRRETTLRGGESGPAMVPGRPDDSLLFERIIAAEMPPESRGQSQRLPEAEIERFRAWLAADAPWPADRQLGLFEATSHLRAGRDWWSLQPIHRPALPRISLQASAANPIDHFIVARLASNDMVPAPPADRRTLVRRLYFDVLGLPPTPAQVDAFLENDSPRAWEELVDQLLASPHYGERWARYWLDVVRFAETCGYERDQLKPGIWQYRDWVINALNNDLPYDRFVTLQLAGDEVADRNRSTVIATGMLRAGTWNDEPNDPADYLYERLEDMVHTTSSALLGLTVKCARCHDHKFDPIAQTDYYRMASFFWAGYVGQANLGGPSAEELGYDVFGWTDRGREADPIRLLIKGDRHRPGDVIEPGFLSAVPQLDRPLDAPPIDSPTTHRRLQLAGWITSPDNPLTARVLVNRLWLHHFGEGLVRSPNNFGFKGERPTHPQLLDWLAYELMSGGRESGGSSHAWSIKHIHRLILTSSTYRQASLHPLEADYAERDFANRLWWRANRRRLDAEALRDAMLVCSGQWNSTMAGPSFHPEMSAEALEGLSRKSEAWQASPADQRARRTVYMITKRSRLLPLMTTFDFGDTTQPCGQREVTTVPAQALALLNNNFVHQQSRAFARRLLHDYPDGSDPGRRIHAAWQVAFNRPPTPDETAAAAAHLAAQESYFAGQELPSEEPPHELAWASLCHVLLNTNEFVYVD